jgi:tryptophan-rich sensory protein
MVISAYEETRIALALFGIQILLNSAWLIIFLGPQSSRLAYADILVL